MSVLLQPLACNPQRRPGMASFEAQERRGGLGRRKQKEAAMSRKNRGDSPQSGMQALERLVEAQLEVSGAVQLLRIEKLTSTLVLTVTQRVMTPV